MRKKSISTVPFLVIMILMLTACANAPTANTSGSETPPNADETVATETMPTATVTLDSPYQYPCHPGEIIEDPEMAAYIDLEKVETRLEGEQLTVIYIVKGIPDKVLVNREGITNGKAEFLYEAKVDITPEIVDDNYQYFIDLFRLKNGDPQEVPFKDALNAEPTVLKLGENGEYTESSQAAYTIDEEAMTITVTAELPGITADSRLSFWTYDKSGYLSDRDIVCSDKLATGNPCVPNNVYIAAERAPFVDIQKVESSLNGEELTVVLFVKDIPDEITVNKATVQYDDVVKAVDYFWGIEVDTDNDKSTGYNGYEYKISIFRSKDSDQPLTGTFEEIYKDYVEAAVNEYEIGPGSKRISVAMAVDQEAATITLVATIPGINADSYLSINAYDYGFDVSVQEDICKR